MNIGHARRKLTPQGDIYLIGYRDLENRLHPATAIHDDIYGNALLFDDGSREVFIFSADFMEIEEQMAEEVKTLLASRYSIDRDAVLLCATHNHTSIVAYHRSWWTHKFDQKYYDWLLETICSAFEECRANAQPALARLGKQDIFGYYDNRIDPTLPVDQEVIVLEFVGEDRNAFAGLVNWATHSAECGPDCTELTSEFSGLTSKKLEPTLGYFPAMIVGAAGDCSNRNVRQGRGIAEVERTSTGIAAEIAAIPRNTPVELGCIMVQPFYHTVAHDDFHLDLRCVVISLGGLHLFQFPGEFGGAFGMRMKDECPVQGLVFGYTNGYFEYFLPEWEYGLSFETAHTQIPKGEPEKIVDKFCQTSALLGNSK